MFSAIFGKSQPVSTMDSAKSFIKFDGKKLRLEDDLDLPTTTPVKVLSILGKARMGKSTFLNTIVSKLTGENTNVFNCQTGIEHCTIGVDYCFLPEHNLLLLDSQGLANGDAQHDPALLLFIYLISDVIIFNDSKILQNEALKLIEPICAFMTYIEDIDNYIKPNLIFRLSDGKLVKDTKKNLSNVLAQHDDQY
jgi:ABC-type cobalamin/Fe3+-siderophores transport system ATPase subunit